MAGRIWEVLWDAGVYAAPREVGGGGAGCKAGHSGLDNLVRCISGIQQAVSFRLRVFLGLGRSTVKGVPQQRTGPRGLL